MAQFYTYILKCSDGTYYTGKTNNLEKRLKQHNGEISGGAKYTRSRRPVNLHYLEKYKDAHSALIRELEIKKLSHVEKKHLQTHQYGKMSI